MMLIVKNEIIIIIIWTKWAGFWLKNKWKQDEQHWFSSTQNCRTSAGLGLGLGHWTRNFIIYIEDKLWDSFSFFF